MKFFENIFKTKPIDFSNEKIEKLNLITENLSETLTKIGQGFRIDYLLKIKLAAEKQDQEDFKKLVISRELFGGSGALWEIWVEDKELLRQFENQFCEFIDLLKSMGIDNQRVNQTRHLMKKMQKRNL